MQTTSYFDTRPDARFFMAYIDGVMVSIRENRRTAHITDGEIWTAFAVSKHLVEYRFDTLLAARRELASVVRRYIDAAMPEGGQRRAAENVVPIWVPIAREEYAVPCPVCGAREAQPCSGRAMKPSKGPVIVVGAPWNPEPHAIEIDLCASIHAARETRHHCALRGHCYQCPH
jgi:hypothetical protein